jgi:hypothetical protein
MFRRSVLFSCLCAGAAGLVLAVSPARAVELPTDGNAKLDSQHKEYDKHLNDLMLGRVEATKDDKDAIDVLAKWYAYRLTWDKNENKRDQINAIMLELESELGRADKARPNSNAFLDMLVRQLIVRAKEVLQHPQVDPIAKVNAARILARVALVGNQDQLANQEVVDACTDVIKDATQNDGARYWAFQAIQNVFAPNHRMPPILLKDQERQKRCIAALNEYVLKKMPVTAETPEENKDGLRVLRREAIHALALTSYPAVVADPKTKKLQSQTALTLAKIIAEVGMMPEPRWYDKACAIEAAIGLGWMQPKLYPDYQPDCAAWFVGWGVLILGKEAADAGAAENKANSNRGWKYYSARLGEALDNLERETKKNYKDKAVVAYVDDLYRQCSEVLRAIDNGAAVNVANVNDWLQGHSQLANSIYKGMPDARVKPAAEPPAEK